MERRRRERHKQIREGIIITLTIVVVVCDMAAVIKENQRQQAQERERTRQESIERILNAESIADMSAGVEHEFRNVREAAGQQETEPDVFASMSMDYGDEIEGFVYYEIPEEYQRAGGYFPIEVQMYTYCLCEQQGVRYALIVAMIERESGYHYDRIGDDGESVGYMQIMQKYHSERMEELSSTDLLNPYQNINVGVDYMRELIERYGTIQDALAVYNYGATGARERLWSNGIYVYSYNEGIMQRMKEIEEELGNGASN
jgi:hypothetical protein|nr:MAG TPA: hypothetical protein [Caudoviricetes sp.]